MPCPDGQHHRSGYKVKSRCVKNPVRKRKAPSEEMLVAAALKGATKELKARKKKKPLPIAVRDFKYVHSKKHGIKPYKKKKKGGYHKDDPRVGGHGQID